MEHLHGADGGQSPPPAVEDARGQTRTMSRRYVSSAIDTADLEQLFQYLSDVIVVSGFADQLFFLSPNVEQILGYSPDELTPEMWLELFQLQEIPPILDLKKGSESESAPSGSEPLAHGHHLIPHHSGHLLQFETTSRLINWKGCPALLTIAHDVTSHLETEEAPLELVQQLKEAHRKADLASQAKSDFLAQVSHELRTPLHGILGTAELLEQTHLTEEQQQYLDALQDSGRIIHSLISDLQDLSKIEAGRLDLKDLAFDLVETVEGLADILGSQAESSGLLLRCQVMPEVPTIVRGDPWRLRQVLINLISNAIKLTERGKVEVKVTKGQDDKIHFSIQDTGIGFNPENMKLIQRTLATKNGNQTIWSADMGLGLSIAHHLLHLMGGTLSISSRVGDGTTYTFELALPPSHEMLIELHQETLHGLRILISDPNPTTRQWLCEVLERAGAEVEQASGGVEVIHTVQVDPGFSCVILDDRMLDLDVKTVVTLLRGSPSLAALPLIITVSGASTQLALQYREIGANAILARPLLPETVVTAMAKVKAVGHFWETSRLGGMDQTILVVEDDAANRRLAREVLRQAGYNVLGARDGEEALQLMKAHSVDAVLMDIEMPNMDGLETTAKIRKETAYAEVPIIALTAHAMKGDAERFLQAGLDDYLSKPVNRRELLETLGREMAKHLPKPKAGV